MRHWTYQRLSDLNRWIGRQLGRGYAGRRSLAVEAAAAAGFLRGDNSVVLDIGANQGHWSRALLAVAGDRIERIYGFEPMAEHREALGELDGERFELVAEAIGAKPGTVPIYAHRPGASIASVYNRDVAHYGMTFSELAAVPMTTVDRFMERRGIDHVDFMKLDIEGHELAALEGAEIALSEGRIGALSFEMGGCNIDARTYLKDFWSFLHPRGFRLFIVNPLDGLHPIDSYHEAHENFLTANFVAARGQA
ncbi:MAG: FkbM family methyltransferase [Alphaproteobacteria bacterium]|nr:FkbM family methyltransferase [Alphaproteobacteria bacterium]